MRSFSRTIKSFFTLLLVAQLISTSVLPVSAALFGGGIKIPSASDWASQIEKRYNLDPEALRNFGQQVNVSDNKKQGPEVSLYFTPSDPKPGEKLTAMAFPSLFSNATEQLYYTWYIRHAECGLKKGPLTAAEGECDLDKDGDITVNDWKTEAMRNIASNGFDYTVPGVYDDDTDNDGYKAIYGGGTQVGISNQCYFHDRKSGINYQLVKNAEDADYPGCSNGKVVCMVGNGEINPGEFDVHASGGSGGGSGSGGAGGDASATGNTFELNGIYDSIAGFPYCSGGSAQCYNGTPCCLSGTSNVQNLTCTPLSDSSCSISSYSEADPYCRHLFPNAPNSFTGNGSFGAGEELYWRTDPSDPDTAGTGNKDEANVAGLGQSRLTWNYLEGDMVGVVVEGTSMIPTKESDSSGMIMWAFSKNNCPIGAADDTGVYQKTIHGYAITIPTIEIDLNNCIAQLEKQSDGSSKEVLRNLIDPTLGGQGTNLDVSVTAAPDNPQNDTTPTEDGDIIEVSAFVNNAAKTLAETYFDWSVSLAPGGRPSQNVPWTNITSSLNRFSDGRKLLSPVQGNAVNTLRLQLNFKNNDQFGGQTFESGFLNGGVGYLRFDVRAAENFKSSGVNPNRKGSSSVIVKFFSTGEHILAKKVLVEEDNPVRLRIDQAGEICSGSTSATDPTSQALARIDTKVCRVLKNEIIGLEIPNQSAALSNFNWTLNGKPLICNTKVSRQCFDDRQGNVAFFPVIGSTGDIITLNLTANKVDARTSTEKVVTLSRSFKIVEPEAAIVSSDESIAWPKVLGQYEDASGQAFTEMSKATLVALSGSTVGVKEALVPEFLSSRTSPELERAWTVDGIPVGSGNDTGILFTANKPDGSIYNIQLELAYRPNPDIRRALYDIWGVSVLDAPEEYFGAVTQLEHSASDAIANRSTGPKKYFALVASYLPASVLFGLRVLLSIGIILFIVGLVFSFTPTPLAERASWRE